MVCSTMLTNFIVATWCFVIVCCADFEFIPIDRPACPKLEGGFAGDKIRPNATCIHQQCTDTEAIVDVPLSALKGYKTYSKLVLVTEDGSSISEEYNMIKRVHYIRLIVPHGNCEAKKKRLAGGFIRYESRPYIAYIGDKSRYYVINVSCVAKPKLPDVTVDWGNASAAMPVQTKPPTCWSNANVYTIPNIVNAKLSLQFAEQANDSFSDVVITFPIASLSAQIASIYGITKGRGEDGSATITTEEKRFAVVVTVEEDNRRAAFSALPHCALGDTHVVMSYPSRHSYLIITAPGRGHKEKDIVTNVEMYDSEGQLLSATRLYQLKSEKTQFSATGCRILSDRPINVVTVMLDAKVPSDGLDLTEDHMVEQLPPVSLWGSEYVVHPVSPRAGNGSSENGFLLRLASHGRSVRFEYLGINGVSFPQVIKAYSYETIDIKEPVSFTVRSTDGTRFMAAIIGKSSRVTEPGPKSYPYMIILQPTRSFLPIARWFPQANASDQAISLVAKQSATFGIFYNNASVVVPNHFWTDVVCPDDEGEDCVNSKYTYLQSDLMHGPTSSLFFSYTNGFGGTMFTRGITNTSGSTGHSGPAKFQHEPPQDEWCDQGWSIYKPTNQCIRIVQKEVRWAEAERICKEFSGMNQSLITLENVDKEAFVSRFAIRFGLSTYYAIGFNMGSDDRLTWSVGGEVYQNGSPVQPHGHDVKDNCGYLQLKDDSHEFIPFPCMLKKPFICQKDLRPPACVNNLCQNGGICVTNKNGLSCQCTDHFSGPFCGEFRVPENGIYEVSGEGIDLVKLIKRQRGEQRDTDSSVTFEVTKFGNLHGFRLISPCSSKARCYGWLTKAGLQVVIARRTSGVRLIRMVPHNDGYFFGFDSSQNYISYSVQHQCLYVALRGNETVIFKMQKASSAGKASSLQRLELPMTRYKMSETKHGTPPQLLALPLTGEGCNPNAMLTACLWFRAFQGSNGTSMPTLSLYNAPPSAKEEMKSSQNGKRGSGWDVLEMHRMFHVKFVEVSTDTVKIGIWARDDAAMIAFTQDFAIPSTDYRHHFCLTKDGVTLDGTSFRFSTTHASSEMVLGQGSTTYIAIGPFLGEIDGFDVWCALKTDEFLFRESAIFPECGEKRGDLRSIQSDDDALATENVEKLKVHTLESACNFCPGNLVLHHGSCFYISRVKATAGAKGAREAEAACPAGNKAQNQRPALAMTYSAHNFVARYIDVTVGRNGEMVWFGLHLKAEKWKWSHAPQTPVHQFFWGEKASSGDGMCGIYKPYQTSLRWTPIPSTLDITPGASSINNYQWGAMQCTEQHQNLCEQKSSILSPTKPILLRLFMMEGSYVARNHDKSELRVYLNTMASIVNAVAAAVSGPVQFQIVRIRSALKSDPVTNDRTYFLRAVNAWRPWPGGANLPAAIQFIAKGSKDPNFRYINVVTSAYSQDARNSITERSNVLVFALGIMQAPKSHLLSFASGPTCVDFAKTGNDAPSTLLSCIVGL